MPESPPPSPEPAAPDLAAGFPVPSLETWHEEVTRGLRGVPFEQAMLTPTPDGITLRPLYTQADTVASGFADSLPGQAPYVRGARPLGHRLEPWWIAQEIPLPDPREFGEALRRDLAAGQTAAVLVLDAAGRRGLDPDAAEAEIVGRGGTSIATLDDVAAALGPAFCSAPGPTSPLRDGPAPILLHAGSAALPAAALCLAHLGRSGVDLTRLRGSFGTDPLADALAGSTASAEGTYGSLAALTLWLEARSPGDAAAKSLVAWGARWREAGASAVEELAYTLAAAVETLRELERRGVDPAVAARRLLFGFAVGPHLLLEVARLRAARMLWSRVCAACGFADAAPSAHLHARTLARNQCAIDPRTNILRATIAAFSAVLGGCDSLTVLPFDLPGGPPSELARRLARNTQLILRDESRLDLVIDAGGGAGAIEALTGETADRTWALFREVEARGGLRLALETGGLQARAADSAEAQRKEVATGREVLVGVNHYANAREPAPLPPRADLEEIARSRAAAVVRSREERRAGVGGGDGLTAALRELARIGADTEARCRAECVEAAIEAAARGATLGELAAALRGAPPVPGARAASVVSIVPGAPGVPEPQRIPPLTVHRLSEDFEALRAAVRALPIPAAGHAHLLLACVGPPAEYPARLEFVRSFFRLAGLTPLEAPACNEPTRAAEFFRSQVAETDARAVVIVSTDARYPEFVPALAAALRTLPSGRSVLLAGRPADAALAESFRKAGVHEFLHRHADAPAILGALVEKLQRSK